MSSPWTLVGSVVQLNDEVNWKVRVGPAPVPPSPPSKFEVVGNTLVTLRDKGGNVFDVKAYGATGDGTTPDWTSINNAVTAMVAAGGGTLYFPQGTYQINQAIEIKNTPFLMRGAGPEASIIKMISTNPTGDFIKTNFGVGTAPPPPPPPFPDREMYMEIRDLKFVSAAATPTAGAAILQQAIPDPHDPPLPLVFQNTFIVRNCWFLNVWDAIHLTDTGSAVIKDCQIINPLHAAIFIESKYNEAFSGVDDAGTTFICDNFIWERGPTAGNHPGQPTHGILATSGVSGMRVHHNSLICYDRPIYIDLTDVGAKTIIHIDHNSFDGGSSDAKIHVTNRGLLHTLDVSSNDFTLVAVGPSGTAVGIGILVDVNGSTVGQGLVNAVIAGNTFNGSDPQQLSRKGIALTPDPLSQAVVQRVLIADNIFTDLNTGIEVGLKCDRIYIGDNAFENVGTPLSVASPTSHTTLGAFFPDRVGVGKLNDLNQRKDLYVSSSDPFGPRLYLQGGTTSSPGIDFAFDRDNSRRAGIVGAAAGASGVQMDFYTKPDGDTLKRRVIIDPNGRFQILATTALLPGAIDFLFAAETSPRASIVATPVSSGAQLELSTTTVAGVSGLRAVVSPEGDFLPGSDGAYNLGRSGGLTPRRWKDVIALTKTSVLNTSFGSGITLVPVLEGPEYLLYDSGSVILGDSGEAFVDLDPRFVEIANTEMPYRVLTSGCKVKDRESKRFRVMGDAGDVVDWMVAAVRAGFENVRFRDAEDGDPVGLQDPEHAVARKSPDNNKA